MLKTPFPSSVFALYLWLSVPIHWTWADLAAVSNVVSFVPIEHRGGVFPFISTVLRTGFSSRSRLFYLRYTLDWGGVYFCTFWLVFLSMPQTHSSSLGTLFLESDVTFCVQFLILSFLGVRQTFVFVLTTCNSKMTFHAIYRDKKNTKSDCRGNGVFIFCIVF